MVREFVFCQRPKQGMVVRLLGFSVVAALFFSGSASAQEISSPDFGYEIKDFMLQEIESVSQKADPEIPGKGTSSSIGNVPRHVPDRNDPASLVVIGKDGRVDHERTVAAIRQEAQKGNAFAQYRLGLAYEFGRGVEQDLNQAAQWYAKAAFQENPAALLNLGVMFFEGRGLEQNTKLGLEHFEKAAALGNAIAQFNLAKAYLEGQGVLADEATALQWLEKSADAGFVMAQYALASFYMEGEGVEQNMEVAFKWYERAAVQGLKEAQAALGLAYEKGYGVTADRHQALRWYSFAAERGHQGAARRLILLQDPYSQSDRFPSQ